MTGDIQLTSGQEVAVPLTSDGGVIAPVDVVLNGRTVLTADSLTFSPLS
ncbi:hypothetical protein [Nocardia wallacei]|nr:hypothetical protein [Nocardia wallacei]